MTDYILAQFCMGVESKHVLAAGRRHPAQRVPVCQGGLDLLAKVVALKRCTAAAHSRQQRRVA